MFNEYLQSLKDLRLAVDKVIESTKLKNEKLKKVIKSGQEFTNIINEMTHQKEQNISRIKQKQYEQHTRN